MGNVGKPSSSRASDFSFTDTSESEPVTPIGDTIPNNGLILNGSFIPEEILILIFHYVDCLTLKKTCKKVCQKWRQLTNEVFMIKSIRLYPQITNLRKDHVVPAFLYENISYRKAYDTNLLKNPSGENGLKYWRLVRNGGDRWIVETPPKGTSVPAEGVEYLPKSCFASSYNLCCKEQQIDLHAYGIGTKILDKLQPEITVSEMYACRFDCSSTYLLVVMLQNADKEEITNFRFKADLDEGVSSWKKVMHTFRNYGPGVKYVCFRHNGQDRKFWAGHYGTKMTESSVVVHLDSLFTRLETIT